MQGIRLLESQDPKKDHEKLFLENIMFSDSFFINLAEKIFGMEK
jgi:hypothetical protein